MLTCKPGETVQVEVYRVDEDQTLRFEVVLDETEPY